MATNIDKQQKFIELRAQGNSFDAIARQIKVSKPTLIKWSKEKKEQIEEIAKTMEEQFILEQKIKRTIRAEIISREVDEAYKALSKTDYKNMSKRDLIITIEKLEKKLEKVTGFGKEISQVRKDEIIREYVEEVKSRFGPPDWDKERSAWVYPAKYFDLF